jgi:hypothetical protein
MSPLAIAIVLLNMTPRLLNLPMVFVLDPRNLKKNKKTLWT